MAERRRARGRRLRALAASLLACATGVGAAASPAHAQTVPPDTTQRPTRGPRARPAPTRRPGLLPPITPGRAFLSSLVVPGLGQSRLQRPTAGAVFVGIEFGIVAMLVKSNADLRSVQAFRTDSVARSYPVDSLGKVLPKPPQQTGGLNTDLVRARRLHREDWIAALIFNHLISGAEAFVSANLYDLPAQISARPSSQGTLVALSVTW